LANCGGYPFDNSCEEEEYHNEHHHTGAYTINPEPAYNPSTVGWFSYQTFLNIPNESFNEIHTEGIWLTGTNIFFDEIKRMLKDEGKLFIDHIHIITKKDGGLVVLEDIILSEYIREEL